MITIAFDESGHFEEADAGPVLVAGLLYDDKGKIDDINIEMKRIEKYLESACISQEKEYPRFLHNKDGETQKDRDDVTKVKQRIFETLGEFLRLGTYEGNPLIEKKREGLYHLFAYLKGNEGKTELKSRNISNLARDDYAANLYVHMAEEMLRRLIFHNPLMDKIELVRVDLATRKVKISNGDQKEDEYKKLGYQGEPSKDGKFYRIANVDNYRTAIEHEILLNEKKNVQIEQIRTRSIKYDKSTKDMSFLYISDVICSIIRDRIRAINNMNVRLQRAEDLFQELTGNNKHFVFGYSDADTVYVRAWQAYEQRDIYQALGYIYKSKHMECEFAKFYSRVWMSFMAKLIRENAEKLNIPYAIENLYNSALNNNINQDELKYIFKELEKCSEKIKDKSVLFKLYDVGISAYNHLGKSSEAKECFEKCKELKNTVEIERFLRSCNKAVVTMTDTFKYEEALALAEKNLSIQYGLSAIKKEFSQNDNIDLRDSSLGRALSQKGQLLAFMNHEETEANFREALNQFAANSADFRITQSYCMHYFIETNQKEKYEKMANDYFGPEKSYYDQFCYIVKASVGQKEVRFSLKFALYVFIKAMYVFYRKEVLCDNNFCRVIKNIEEELVKKNRLAKREINGHPWEIIFKYLALFALDMGEKELANQYIEKASQFIPDYGSIIGCINQYGRIEYFEKLGNMKKMEMYIERLWGKLDKMLGNFPGDMEKSEQSRRERLKNMFTYMYH